MDFLFCRYERSDVCYGNFEISALVTIDGNIFFVDHPLAAIRQWNAAPDFTSHFGDDVTSLLAMSLSNISAFHDLCVVQSRQVLAAIFVPWRLECSKVVICTYDRKRLGI